MNITLTTLEKGIIGLIAMTPEHENIFQSLYKSKVPEKWLKSNIITIIQI